MCQITEPERQKLSHSQIGFMITSQTDIAYITNRAPLPRWPYLGSIYISHIPLWPCSPLRTLPCVSYCYLEQSKCSPARWVRFIQNL